MTTYELDTREPITITLEISDYGDSYIDVQIDGLDYATITNHRASAVLDLDKVKCWVENTYYEGAYKNSMYTPSQLQIEEFRADTSSTNKVNL